ncbi:MAG TPA: hypothetical protein VIK01_27715 [Polyangiaceae bacterium]
MLKIERAARRYGLAIAALISGGIIFWIALRSSMADWYISETHADIIYTGLRRFGEFPFFSFVFNGGSYFLQDPQSNLFSPAVPLILLAGPSVGLRLMECVWGILGVYTFAVWMRRRVSGEAAVLGAIANVLGLGVLWRVTAGNDMFLWHLGLPLLLWCFERVMKERTLHSTLCLALALGVLLLGPTFHSFIYLFLPAVPVFVVLEWAFHRPSLKAFAKTLLLFAAASALALLIASPKLACWLKFPMSRQIIDHGVLSVRTAFRCLFDYSISHRSAVPTTRYVQAGERVVRHQVVGQLLTEKLGMEECAVALPPTASLFALVGLVAGVWRREYRQSALFSLLLIAWAAALCCSWPVWSTFRALTGGNFRVAPRYLGMAAFGLCVLAALGADTVFARWKRAALPTTVVAATLMWGSAIWWTIDASHSSPLAATFAVQDSAFNPLTRYREERDAVTRLSTFTELNELDTARRDILRGSGLSDGFLIVGNAFKPGLYRSKIPLPIVVRGTPQAEVTVEHLRIKVAHLGARARVVLRALEPRYGMSVRTVPEGAEVDVRGVKDQLVIENRGRKPVERVIIRAELPISPLWFLASGACLLSVVAGLILRKRTRPAPAVVEA